MSEHAESLLEQMLLEQRKTNQLLSLLIEALADEEGSDPDAPPLTYMDGSPVL